MKNQFDEQYQRLFKAWKVLQSAMGINCGMEHISSFQAAWTAARLELKAGAEPSSSWHDALSSRWLEAARAEFNSAPMEIRDANPADGPWKLGHVPAAAFPEVSAAFPQLSDWSRPHQQSQSTFLLLRAFVDSAPSERGEEFSNDHISFNYAMSLAKGWTERVAQAGSHTRAKFLRTMDIILHFCLVLWAPLVI